VCESTFEEGEAREDTGDESFVLGAEGGDDGDVGDDGYWWWQLTEAKAAWWVVPQWEVLAADRGGVEGRVEGPESERKWGRRFHSKLNSKLAQAVSKTQVDLHKSPWLCCL
jgi:hypothetical protein